MSIKERSAGVTFKCPDYLQSKTATTEVEKNVINLSKAIQKGFDAIKVLFARSDKTFKKIRKFMDSTSTSLNLINTEQRTMESNVKNAIKKVTTKN